MPVFKKKTSQLKTRRDKWLYFLQNLPDLEQIPSIMREKVFQKAFHTAEVSAMNKKDRDSYEYELNHYRTYWATIDTAEKRGVNKGLKRGKAEGIEIGKAEGEKQKAIDIAKNMKKKGLDSVLIAEMTGLSPEEIKRLK